MARLAVGGWRMLYASRHDRMMGRGLGSLEQPWRQASDDLEGEGKFFGLDNLISSVTFAS